MRLYEPPVLPRLLLLLHATPLRWDRDAEEEDRKKEEMDAMATPYQYGTHQPPKQVVRPKGKLFLHFLLGRLFRNLPEIQFSHYNVHFSCRDSLFQRLSSKIKPGWLFLAPRFKGG